MSERRIKMSGRRIKMTRRGIKMTDRRNTIKNSKMLYKMHL